MSDPKLLRARAGHHARHRRAGRVAAARRCAGSASATGRCWAGTRGCAQAGGLALWAVVYVLIGQAGYIVTTRVAADSAAGARHHLRERLAAAAGALRRARGLAADRADAADEPGRRRGPARGGCGGPVAGQPAAGGAADPGVGAAHGVRRRRSALRCSGCARPTWTEPPSSVRRWPSRRSGCCPTASRCCRLRVFYALTDSRTPTLIQLVTVAVKIPLLLLSAVLLPAPDVVLGLAAANSASFLVGAVVGQLLLRRRLGRIPTGAVLSTVAPGPGRGAGRRAAGLRGRAAGRWAARRRRPTGPGLARAGDRLPGFRPGLGAGHEVAPRS